MLGRVKNRYSFHVPTGDGTTILGNVGGGVDGGVGGSSRVEFRMDISSFGPESGPIRSLSSRIDESPPHERNGTKIR